MINTLLKYFVEVKQMLYIPYSENCACGREEWDDLTHSDLYNYVAWEYDIRSDQVIRIYTKDMSDPWFFPV